MGKCDGLEALACNQVHGFHPRVESFVAAVATLHRPHPQQFLAIVTVTMETERILASTQKTSIPEVQGKNIDI